MCLYNIQNTNIICLYDLTHLKDLWLILTLILIRWNLEWINLLVCHETSAYTTRFRCTLSNTWNVPVPSGTIALQGSRASRGESCGWNLQKLDISSVHWMKPPRKDKWSFSLAWWWHHLKMRQESDLGSSPLPSTEKILCLGEVVNPYQKKTKGLYLSK